MSNQISDRSIPDRTLQNAALFFKPSLPKSNPPHNYTNRLIRMHDLQPLVQRHDDLEPPGILRY
jgi:hypothetical protein